MFSAGDCSRWLIVEKDELIGADGDKFYDTKERTILRSSDSTGSHETILNRRKDNKGDPLVNIKDASAKLYAGKGMANNNFVLSECDGADVFIRKSRVFSVIPGHENF
jgi:hypothetical protein